MKKLLALLLTLVMTSMIVLSLAGCASKDSATSAAGSSAAKTGSTTSSDTAAAQDDWSYIKAKGTLVIGYTIFKPMNYLDDSGNLVGFDTDFAKAVCEKLGVTPKFVEINWDTKEVELNAKSIDCIWNGFTVTADRKENITFTQSYMQNKQIVVIKKSNESKFGDKQSLAKANLVAETKSAGESAIQGDEVLSGASYVPVDKQTDALMEVKAGTADAAVLDYILSGAMVGDGTDYSDLMMVPNLSFSQEEYAVGFRKDSTTAEKVNEAINALLKDGTLSKIAQQYNVSGALINNQK
jgi:polar amino acid transport system substrate-binding protein